MKQLSRTQRLVLQASAAAGGPYPVRMSGAGELRSARSLVEAGLGNLDGKRFTASAAGVAAIAMHNDA